MIQIGVLDGCSIGGAGILRIAPALHYSLTPAKRYFALTLRRKYGE
jgi:hypothetical protein